MDRPKILPTNAMARRLGVPVKWLQAEARENKLPHVKAGTVFLFDPNLIEKILLKRAREEGSRNAG